MAESFCELEEDVLQFVYDRSSGGGTSLNQTRYGLKIVWGRFERCVSDAKENIFQDKNITDTADEIRRKIFRKVRVLR